MGMEQIKELKRLNKENERFWRAVTDLTLNKLILKNVVSADFQAIRIATPTSIFRVIGSK
jgi:hypothetical protein